MDMLGTLAAVASEWDAKIGVMLDTVIYFVIALVLFFVAIWLCDRLVPFSIRKEIEEDHNTALAILMGAGLLSLAIIVAAVVD